MTTKADDENVQGGNTKKKVAVPINYKEFTPEKWVFKKMPEENDKAFTWVSGLRHRLSQ